MMFWRRRPRQRFQDPWDRNVPLIQFGKHDFITLGSAYENVAIFGGVGSGKSSGSGYILALAMLTAGFGGLVLTAKKGEAERWRRMAKLAGRSDDLIVVTDGGDFQLNFLDYHLELQGRNANAVENLVTILDTVIKIAERASGQKAGKGQEAFWEQGIRKLARAVIGLLVLARGQVSVSDMLEIMRNMPRTTPQAQNEAWQSNSLICQLILIARQRATNEYDQHDLRQIESYFLVEFPSIAERTRSVFETGLYGILDLLSRGTLHRLFSYESNASPDLCNKGKIIVVDLPVSTHDAIGMIAQTLFKLAFQKMAQHRTAEDRRPLFLMADEFQELVTIEDFRFASISREARVVNCFITQSIASLYSVLGADESGKAACDAILGLASLKIFHSNACPIMNSWAAELIGRRRTRMFSASMNHEPIRNLRLLEPEPGFTSSANETFEFAVMPHEFSLLAKGGPPRMQSEAIVYGGGRRWHSSGDTYLRTFFNQGF